MHFASQEGHAHVEEKEDEEDPRMRDPHKAAW